MKTRISTMILTLIFFILISFSVCASSAPKSYMGFSVSEDWYVFSKETTDKALLDAVGLSQQEVTEALINAGCEHFLINSETKTMIYIKVQKNDVSREFYDIVETENQILLDSIVRIMQKGFGMDAFLYDGNHITITEHPQMKFITVPGIVTSQSENHGMVFGGTFVNGSAISFMMHLDDEIVTEEDLETMKELANSVSFTLIQEKDEAVPDIHAEEKPQTSVQYLLGGFGGVILVALCFYFIAKIRKTERTEEDEKDESEQSNEIAD